jgi:hypothetical protein
MRETQLRHSHFSCRVLCRIVVVSPAAPPLWHIIAINEKKNVVLKQSIVDIYTTSVQNNWQ